MLTQELEGTETPPVTRVAGWIVSYCLHLAKVWVAEPLKRAAKPARGMAKFYIRARQYHQLRKLTETLKISERV